MSYNTYFFNYAGYFIEIDAKKNQSTRQSNCCLKCNVEYNNNDQFCMHCGSKLSFSEIEYTTYTQNYVPSQNRIHIAGHKEKNWIIPLDEVGFLHRECRGIRDKKEIKIAEFNERQIFDIDEFNEYMNEVFIYLKNNKISFEVKMGIVSDWC